MRVLICRAVEDVDATASLLAAAGHDALSAPVLRIVRQTPTLPPAAGIAALMATSAHAFGAPPSLDAFRATPLFAVGERTAAAARAQGLHTVRAVAGGDARTLAGLVGSSQPPGAALLYLAGRPRKPDLETLLREAGFALTVAETYAAEEAPPWRPAVRDALRSGTVSACLHFSRRSAALALRFAEAAGAAEAFGALRHLCVSGEAATPLRSAGILGVAVASHPDAASLVREIDAPER